MPTNVIMPALGVAQETGKVLRWIKPEGAQVQKGEPLIEIETDKATVEIEAPASGYLTQVVAREGDDVPVGQTIAVISETAAAAKTAAPAPPPAPGSHPSASGARGGPDADAPRTGASLPPASPKARRLAREQGLDVAALPGTGPGGAVLAADVAAAAPAAERAGTGTPPAYETVTPSSVWRRMAERTVKSWTTAPHFFLVREVNASRLVGWREAWKRRFKEEVTYTDLLVVLVAAALRQHRRINAAWEEGTIKVIPDINIGVAVATDDALVVPVIHRADTLRVTEISTRLRDLVARAQAGRLRPEDVGAGTFTISNLGMYDVDVFQAVINPPQAAILAVGRIADRVVAMDGAPHVQPMMMLSLSCDHRVVDGARAAQFLKTLADLVEEPLDHSGRAGGGTLKTPNGRMRRKRSRHHVVKETHEY
jgi:pyruvate dehydrogenase E2 component (dihydrolipoamide acetyltransferase)